MEELIELDTKKIKSVVNKTIYDELKFPNYKDKKHFSFPKKEQMDDPNKEFSDMATDFVINEYLKYSEMSSLFIYTIFNIFNTAIEFYCLESSISQKDILFAYKGGNVLRIIAREFLNELPGKVHDVIEKYYGEFFKKSDADFSIYINPKLKNYDKVFNDWTIISYFLLSYIRDIFKNNETKFFEFHRYNSAYKKEKLAALLKKLNNAEGLKKEDSIFYKKKFIRLISRDVSANESSDDDVKERKAPGARQDKIITPSTESKDEIVAYDIDEFNKIPSDYYISINNSLSYNLQDLLMKFNLVRMKVNFVTEIIDSEGKKRLLNLGGELIDISIAHKDTANLDKFFEKVNENIKEFRVEKPISFSFKAYSLEYFIHDLELILFETVKLPWLDNKYKKRINRLLFLYFVDLLALRTSIDIKEEYLLGAIRDIQGSLNNPKILEEKLNQKIIDSKTFNLHFAKFFEELKRIIKEGSGDKEKFKDFIDNVNNNFQIMLDTIRELKNYIKDEGVLNQTEIYDIDQQIGGKLSINYNKYRKYKKEYFKLKKHYNNFF